MNENWLPVPTWEGFYEVSDQGRVRSVDRVIEHPTSGSSFWKGRILKQSAAGRSGHLVVTLIDSVGRRRRVAKVHQLVLEAFVGPRADGMECCHANDIPADNRLSNLRWDTHAANTQDQVRNGRHNMLAANRERWQAA